MNPAQESLDSARKLVRTYGSTIAVAIGAALFIRCFVIEAYRIPNNAMHPALESGDTIFVSKSYYGIHLPYLNEKITAGEQPYYGDVAVFMSSTEPPRESIRRIVAIQGDTVEIKSGHVLVNSKDITLPGDPNRICGEEEPPSHLVYSVCWEPPIVEDMEQKHIPNDSVFLMGDLRSQGENKKGKIWSIVPLTALRGKALWVWLSIDPRTGGRASWFSRIRFERMFRKI